MIPVHYWRTTTGVEVDFVLHGPKGLLAFEIKRSRNVSRKDAKGLLSFQQDYPEAKLYLIHGGDKTYHFGDVEAIPMADSLVGLVDILRF